MKRKTLVVSLIAASLFGCGVVGYCGNIGSFCSQSAENGRPSPEKVRRGAGSQNASALPNFEAIAARYGPAVVNVSVTQEGQYPASIPEPPELGPSDPPDHFFRPFQNPLPTRNTPTRGVGSGFIITHNGLILTDVHVVGAAKRVDVKLTDKREFTAKVIGVDMQSDVAVLKINAENLPVVKLGDPATLRVGDWVVAIGSPFGFENTVTQGIVSAKSRTLPDEAYVPFIQTDVPINPGSSGGPLFDMKGEVIGINAKIYSRSGGYEGLSFAIPIDTAADVLRQVLEHGQVTRGYLGVTVEEITPRLAQALHLDTLQGTLVSAVEPGSPAAKAGLERGDVILKVDGKQIINSADLPVQVAARQPGTVVKLEVLRNGVTEGVDATLDKLRNTAIPAAAARLQDAQLGLLVRPLTTAEQQQVGDDGGLLVESVTGPAAEAGIRPGDLIIAMNGTRITSAKQLNALLATAAKRVSFLVRRNNVKIFVPMELG